MECCERKGTSMSCSRRRERNQRNYPVLSVVCNGTANGTTTELRGTSNDQRFRSVPVRFRCQFRSI